MVYLLWKSLRRRFSNSIFQHTELYLHQKIPCGWAAAKVSVIGPPYQGQKWSRCVKAFSLLFVIFLVPGCIPSVYNAGLIKKNTCVRVPQLSGFLYNNEILSHSTPPSFIPHPAGSPAAMLFCRHIEWEISALLWLITVNEGQCHLLPCKFQTSVTNE